MSAVVRKKYVDVAKVIAASRDDIALAVAETGKARAIGLAPVDTGNLVGSLNAKKLGGGKAQYGSNVEYAAYQEFGTRKMKAQPYMRPSADWLKNQAGKVVTKILRGALRRG